MYPEAYVQYLCHFHGDRDYFECHEILEEYWKSKPQPREAVWVGLIQIAVSLYHQRRGNMAGAAKMMESAIRIVVNRTEQVHALGLDHTALVDMLQQRLAQIKEGAAYTSLNLPISDPGLQKQCEQCCDMQGVRFGQPSQLDNLFLLHKHTLRDRSDVIQERLESLRRKKNR
ncbi:DUF309 domain-containing protein [Brevibacillus humidisoli]|uniref:DUF309 domain-containing protein n=1 Tax=Brevibacillus humidisoli TaxID=2895522 RepID=UPI001E394740|nr:DUF309 domain-containing protein [Brevibacillus humidisoli]UFJ43226.1 DUF309 domain-containing protein [Brevibacillus humidisoli]